MTITKKALLKVYILRKVYDNVECNKDDLSMEHNQELWDSVICAFTDGDRREDSCQGTVRLKLLNLNL